MTTTERPSRPITASQVRSSLVALLATGYLLAWWSFATPASAPSAPEAEHRLPAQPTVWLAELPASARPAVSVPAGWHVVDRAEPASVRSIAPAPIRVSSARRGRVRTRSS